MYIIHSYEVFIYSLLSSLFISFCIIMFFYLNSKKGTNISNDQLPFKNIIYFISVGLVLGLASSFLYIPFPGSFLSNMFVSCGPHYHEPTIDNFFSVIISLYILLIIYCYPLVNYIKDYFFIAYFLRKANILQQDIRPLPLLLIIFLINIVEYNLIPALVILCYLSVETIFGWQPDFLLSNQEQIMWTEMLDGAGFILYLFTFIHAVIITILIYKQKIKMSRQK